VIYRRQIAATTHRRGATGETVKDLTAGSGLVFTDRGEHELKGVPGSWRLYAVER